MTKAEADRDVLAFFERQHQKRLRARVAAEIARAEAGDRWLLGQLHMRAIEGHSLIAKLLDQSPILQAMLTEKCVA